MFSFEHPWIFLLAPLPLLIAWFIPPSTTTEGASLRVPFYDALIKTLRDPTHHARIPLKYLMRPTLVWLLLLIAYAGPQTLGPPVPLERTGRDIMLAIDISKSMSLTDMELKRQEVSRLTVVKSVASEFIHARQGDRLGLIVFGSKAYVRAPLTFDLNTVDTLLQDTTIGLAGNQTAMGDAIGLAVKHLPSNTDHTRVLVLLTDGVNNVGVSPEAMAQLAKKHKIKIYTIAFGHDEVFIDTLLGSQRVPLPLDEAGLKHIADITAGQYFRAEETTALSQVYQTLNQLEPIAHDAAIYRKATQLYPFPLALALILSILPSMALCFKQLTKKRRTHALVSN